ncbi:sugar transferase [Halarcobacter anaerophilus]|uniref:UDP-phosphate galactose phosphotransferase n=1 Tax=Halarcobacter anaerophilus TaxID=877500 RepID=A0A4Q0Y3L9_9BACT|nr:sugar transferase [Halarcobacter anaerophilus]QDF29508.1 undecaprenyl-phosphate galactose phosphotransferase [Halarcobacter anaerophilus]RXJ64747.1 UDP-phosphate galactose phosphotransferase [Halarcobacter anaerophilus]
MMKNRWAVANSIYIIVLFLSDLFVMFLSLKLAFYIRVNFFADFFPTLNTSAHKYYWILFLTSIIFLFEKIYFTRYDFWSDTKRIFKGLFISFVFVFTVITLTKMSQEYSRAFIIIFYLLAIFLIPTSKRILKRILFKFNFFRINVKVVGNSDLVDELENELKDNWYFGYNLCKKKFKMVILISKNLEVEQFKRLIKIYSKKTRNVYIIPYVYHLDFTHADIVDYFNVRLSTIHLENRLLSYKNIFIKVFFEKILVLCILPFGLMLHLFMIILIKKDSEGKVLFKQKRLGLKGEKFSCYKYRTMYENGDEILKEYLSKHPNEVEYYEKYHKYQNDPRITKIGKILRATSLDEFPQFFNVLRGDMNLMGPRPYMISEKEKIGKYNQDIILDVKPGITGLWQVSGRNNLTFDERVQLDKWYINNWSLWMDFVIFMKTIHVVFSKIGAK